MIESYQDLVVWQRAMQMTVSVYQLTRQLPKDEMFGLTSQMRRAAVSVASNIAEGYGRNSAGEYRQFLGMARGSNLELQTQILLCPRLGYCSSEQSKEAFSLSTEVGKMLNSLLTKL